MAAVVDAAGVRYEDLDEFKVRASKAALTTAGFRLNKRWRELPWTRGESAYAMQNDRSKQIIAAVIEGLGTKNLVALNQELRHAFGRTFYDWIARDNVAMIVNDMITIGALPLIFMLHPALAQGDHLKGANGNDLIAGTLEAMQGCSCVWGPGETPELDGLIVPETMSLSGAAVGTIDDEQFLINPANIRPGQKIIGLGSSGIHANGLSKARAIAATLPGGYLRQMPSGQTFGEALLTPTKLYAHFIEACQDRGVPIAYAINMTGHGWRKIMRPLQPFTYRVQQVPKPHEVFTFMMEHGKISLENAYKAFNMGIGFVVIVEEQYVRAVEDIALECVLVAMNLGVVEEGPRQVIIEPHDLVFDELSIR